MQQQVPVSEFLKLLADFRTHVFVARMQRLKFPLEGVDIRGRELTRSRPLARSSRTFAFSQIPFAVSQTAQVCFAETADGVEHVQCPAALGDGNVFQRFDATELCADFGCRGNLAFGDDGDAGLTSGGSGSFLARSASGNL